MTQSNPFRQLWNSFRLTNQKIQNKLLGIVLLVVLLSVTTLTIFNAISLSKSNLQAIAQELSSFSQEAIQHASDRVQANAQSLEALALSPSIISAVEAANSAYSDRNQAEIDAQVASQDEAWKNEDSGLEALVQSIQTNETSSHLASFKNTFPEQVEVFLTDKQGLVIGMTDRTGDYLQADEEWWLKAYNDGKGTVYVSPVEYDESAQTWAVDIGVPIRATTSGVVTGVLRGTVDVSVIFQSFAAKTFGETGQIALFDRTGRILYAPNPDLLMQPVPETLRALTEVRETGWRDDLEDLDGQPAVIAYSPIQGELADTLGWVIVVDQDLKEVQAPVKAAVTRAVLVAIVTALILESLGLLLALSISRPIATLTTQMRRLSIGEVQFDEDEQRLMARMSARGDELGETGRAFTALVNYLSEMAAAAQHIATGDLTVSVQPRSEQDLLSVAFSQMAASLSHSVEQVAMSAHHLGDASSQLAQISHQAGQATSQIAATIQEVARGTSQQSEAVNRTAALIEGMSHTTIGISTGAEKQASAVGRASNVTAQITAAIQQVQGNVQAVTKESSVATQASRNGAVTVQETIRGMERIREKVGQSAERVQEMGRRSDQIGTIVETIDDIAAQTNLLALNAAIEAARAGEHGKGFSVVADEVRKLAERASTATKEIGGLIRGIQTTIADAVAAMETSAREVEAGVERANGAGQALEVILKASETVFDHAEQAIAVSQRVHAASNELVIAVDTVSAVVEENYIATREIANRSNEITEAIENIASVSEENTAAVEEVSASTEEMSAQVEEVSASAQALAEMAQDLKEFVSRFQLEKGKVLSSNVNGGATGQQGRELTRRERQEIRHRQTQAV